MRKLIVSIIFGILSIAPLKGEPLDRQWTIYLVQQTHTDIGYTRPQSEILSEHLRYIDYAIDFCDLTRDYPDEAKFRWTCEAAWAVEEYIKQRPQKQTERLKECIRRGQIEVTGMYFNMSEIADEESYRYFLHPVRKIRDAGIPVRMAMQDDVNGAAWCLTDYLHDMGVRYFWMGPNQTRSLLPFEIPTVFKWESPSGNDVICFRSMHYMTANFWGIEKNDSVKFREGAEAFLKDIASRGYPYDAIGIQHLGYYVDNAPPSVKICDFVREWNKTHDNPKLRTATASEFLDYVCTKYGTDNLSVERVAWPDWWTDGFGSAARETGEARKAHADMTAVTGLLSLAYMEGDKLPGNVKSDIEDVYDDLLFYDEHTFGANESIKDPASWNSQIQFENKASYSWSGFRKAKLLYETAGGLLQDHIRTYEDVPSLTVFNPLLWTRDAYAEVFADYDIIPSDREAVLVSENGDKAEIQAVRKAREGRYFLVYARDVPSLGYRTYRVSLKETGQTPQNDGSPSQVLENRYYRIQIDPGRGGIVSITDKIDSCRELVDVDNDFPLGTLIYETLETRNIMKQFRCGGFVRTAWKNVSLSKGVSDGSVFNSVVMTGYSDAADDKGICCEVRLYKDSPKIELCYRMRRPSQFKENAVYVAFPFTRSNPELAVDVQGGLMCPGKNQLEGSATDWNTMQNFVAARGDGHQIVLTSREVPLVMLGSLMQEAPLHYTKEYDTPAVYSWVMNNYWFTNFKASQQDEFSWSYVLTSTDAVGDNAYAAALRSALSERVGLYGRVVPQKSVPSAKPELSCLLQLDSGDGVVAVNSAPASFRDGVIVQLRNTGPEPGFARFLDNSGKELSVQKVDALENNIGRPLRGIFLSGNADIFVLIR